MWQDSGSPARRNRCCLVLLLSATLCAEVLGDEPPGSLPLKYRGHNLVFVSFDALQAAHVGCLGYPRNVTPTIDSVAAQGFNFTRNYSVASWTDASAPKTMTSTILDFHLL